MLNKDNNLGNKQKMKNFNLWDRILFQKSINIIKKKKNIDTHMKLDFKELEIHHYHPGDHQVFMINCILNIRGDNLTGLIKA